MTDQPTGGDWPPPGDDYPTPMLARRSPRETDIYPLTVRRRSIRAYGWNPDHPDHRDRSYEPHRGIKVRAKLDLERRSPQVYDQGLLGSCTANAIAAAIQYDRMQSRAHAPTIIPSRLFIYFGQRVIAGTIPCDSGGSLRDGLKVAAKDGVCLEGGENGWPYDISRFADCPPRACFKTARKVRISHYSRIRQNIEDLELCLSEGFPFVFGFTAFAELEECPFAKDGRLRMPRSPSARPIGSHAAMAIGYDRSDKTFKVRNSWGRKWGLRGYFKIPYDYLGSPRLAGDFWTIRTMTDG